MRAPSLIKSRSVATDSEFGSFRLKGSKSKLTRGKRASDPNVSIMAITITIQVGNGLEYPENTAFFPCLEDGNRLVIAGNTVKFANNAMNIPLPAINPSSANPT